MRRNNDDLGANDLPLRIASATAFVAAATMALVGLVATPAAASGWKTVADEAGIKVSLRRIPGQQVPVMRASGVIEANYLHVFSVIWDASRHSEWMHRCSNATLLRVESDLQALAYNRIDAPWPVSDRDVVYRAKASIDSDSRRARINFRNVEVAGGPITDAVRMPMMRGYYRMRALSDNATLVTYEVQAAAGGAIPRWVARMAGNELPLWTLLNLRSQTRNTRGDYRSTMTRFGRPVAALPANAPVPATLVSSEVKAGPILQLP